MQTETLILAGLLLVVIALQLALLLRRSGNAALENALREEQRNGRGELREQLEGMSRQQDARMDGFSRNLTDLSTRTDQRLDLLRDSLTDDARKGREENAHARQQMAQLLDARLQDVRGQLDAFGQQQQARMELFAKQLAALQQALLEETRNGRQESGDAQQRFGEMLGQRLAELTQRNEQRIAEMRQTLEARLKDLQDGNDGKLELMRQTVDEKLQSTLNTRLDSSFKLVSERLEQVQRGLGEMQQLATGVGDLKRVLGNVKTRGILGEVQLGALLEQLLTPDQYAANVAVVPNSDARVEYAVHMPNGVDNAPLWLSIDAKFPLEDYQRLQQAQEDANAPAAMEAANALERRVREEAKRIRSKYIVPPHTVDFAILFLPTEGLFAEVLRRPGLFEALQREHHITVAGPTTLAAILTSLKAGFRTLAIEKRSSEVWRLLGAVKTEFGKFGMVLDKVKKNLDQASNQIDATGVRTRQIERKLRGVETLPGELSQQLLETPAESEESDEPGAG